MRFRFVFLSLFFALSCGEPSTRFADMSVQPFYSPKFRAFDSNGDPLAGGLLYSYAAGTTTPLATYTTKAGSVANANPVVLDANGEADVWTTPGVDYKFVLKNSVLVIQWTVDNVPSPSATSTNSANVAPDPGGRLSLTSLTPVTTADVTGATTVYYVPQRSNVVPLYDGTSWTLNAITTELSQTTVDTTKSPAAVATSSNYDMFVWSDSGTLRLSRGPAWSSGTTRGTGAGTTELERVSGRYVNKVSIANGPAAQRGLYVGTIASDGSAQINDSLAKRHVWNAYNRVSRALRGPLVSVDWTYTTATYRQAGGGAGAANQLDLVIGLSEDRVFAEVIVASRNAAGELRHVAIGLDSITAIAAGCLFGFSASTTSAEHSARWGGYPGLGRHYLAWLEYSGAAGATDWYAGLAGRSQTGILGEVFA